MKVALGGVGGGGGNSSPPESQEFFRFEITIIDLFVTSATAVCRLPLETLEIICEIVGRFSRAMRTWLVHSYTRADLYAGGFS